MVSPELLLINRNITGDVIRIYSRAQLIHNIHLTNNFIFEPSFISFFIFLLYEEFLISRYAKNPLSLSPYKINTMLARINEKFRLFLKRIKSMIPIIDIEKPYPSEMNQIFFLNPIKHTIKTAINIINTSFVNIIIITIYILT